MAESALCPGNVVLAMQSPYQRIVVAEHDGAFDLFLNGNLQFSSRDEYRYHEALVRPAMAAAERNRHVVVGGGGDGLAVREILRHPGMESVTVVVRTVLRRVGVRAGEARTFRALVAYYADEWGRWEER
jgi:spermidine synthase